MHYKEYVSISKKHIKIYLGPRQITIFKDKDSTLLTVYNTEKDKTTTLKKGKS